MDEGDARQQADGGKRAPGIDASGWINSKVSKHRAGATR